MMLTVYIDGACEPNPDGTAAYGVVVLRRYLERYGAEPTDVEPVEDSVWEEGKVVGSGSKMSNNVAEYAGLIAFLEWYQSQNLEEKTTIYLDSQLLVNQMEGKWFTKKGLYVPYYEKATSLAFQIEGIRRKLFGFKWIPREENLADELSVKALAEVGILRRKKYEDFRI